MRARVLLPFFGTPEQAAKAITKMQRVLELQFSEDVCVDLVTVDPV